MANLLFAPRVGIPRHLRGAALVLAAFCGAASLAPGAMPGAPAGVTETGVPSFVVLGPEALGLSSDPIDLQLLPDGRVLVVSQRELAFGDGERWSAHRQADNLQPIFDSVAVGGDGEIYAGTGGEIARVEFSADGRWQFATAATLPNNSAVQNTTLVSVVTLPNRWFWYGGNGAIVSWRPGETARLAGHFGSIERIFTLDDRVFVSDQSSGGLYRLKADGGTEPVKAADTLASETVTCAIPLAPEQLLVGTAAVGLKIFDGKKFRPFGPPGLLNSGARITDLCAAGDGYYAAAVDTVGIVFFDREGRVVQVLDRSLDHRLARVQLLRYASNGVLWAQLNEGVARVEFPYPISNFAPLLAGGLTFAKPLRHAGTLWILSDGRAMRGAYDGGGRLERFLDDTPPGRYLFTLADVDGQLLACNDQGIYLREDAGWRKILSGIVNARVGVAPAVDGRICYVARGEYGTIERLADGNYVAHRISLPKLGDSYGAIADAAGIGWIELGTNLVARFDPKGDMPRLQILGADDGLHGGWTEIYVLGGVARFHGGDTLCRFDGATGKFVDDRDLLARLPQLAGASGRPVTDNHGRLWYTANGVAQVIDLTPSGGNRPVKVAPVGFAPTNYTVEDDGVIWMFEKGRLVRMDPRMPVPQREPPRALITSVQLMASGRRLFAPGAELDALDYADNSLMIRFAAPSNPFEWPVTFEVLLEGAGSQWVSTGAVGSAAFNHLKEGKYVFRVRPVTEGGAPGREARLRFAVRPPWYRSMAAWVAYVLTAIGLIGFVMWLSSYLQRRENTRLEQLVAARTAELHASNDRLAGQMAETTAKSAALAASEERVRALNAELERRVEARTRELGREQARFKFIFDTAPVGLTWMRRGDLETRIVNPAYARISGVPVEQGHDPAHYRDTSHPEDRARRDVLHAKLSRGEIDHYELEKRYLHRDGTTRWAVLAVRNFRDDSGEQQEITTLFDITDRKLAERELAEASGLLESILANMPDMVYFKDRDSRFVRFSTAFARRFNLEPAAIRGRTDFDMFGGEHAQQAFDDEQGIIRSGEPIIGKLEKETYADGRVTWALTTKMPWRDGTGAIIGTFGISKDVTAWKDAETKLAETHRQLLVTSREAGMAEVATGVLHNVGNVLNSVNVSATLVADHIRHTKAANIGKLAEMLAQNKANLAEFLTNDPRGRMVPDYLGTLAEMIAEEGKSVTAELENLRKNVEHIKEIVAMQQAYARTSGMIETVGVVDLLEDAIRINAGSLARHDVDIVRDYQDRSMVTTDRHKVIQILINLVRNAKYACDESGRTDKSIALRTARRDRKVRIEVADNGVGIPAENLTRIFNHGFTTRQHGHGFGLHSGALAAKELGGALTVFSEGPNRGATFTLELPYKSEDTNHAQPAV